MLQAATLSVSVVVQYDSLPFALCCCDFAGLLLVLESEVTVPSPSDGHRIESFAAPSRPLPT
jgi:hypothetical protein